MQHVYSMRWNVSSEFLAATCSVGRLQFWCALRPECHHMLALQRVDQVAGCNCICMHHALKSASTRVRSIGKTADSVMKLFSLTQSQCGAFRWRPSSSELRGAAAAKQRTDATQAAVLPCGSLFIPQALASDSMGRLVRTGHMLNCVRFGIVAGQERAVVAAQNGFIYLFAVPTWASEEQIPVRCATVPSTKRIIA